MEKLEKFEKNLRNLFSIIQGKEDHHTFFVNIWKYLWLNLLIRKEQLHVGTEEKTPLNVEEKIKWIEENIENILKSSDLEVSESMKKLGEFLKKDEVYVGSAVEHFDEFIYSLEKGEIEEFGTGIYRYLLDTDIATASSNPRLMDLMIELIDYKPNMSVYDPAFGYGRIFKHLRDRFGYKGLIIAGQEINESMCFLTKVIMYFFEIDASQLKCGDTLTEPKHVNNYELEKFDRVFVEPPFGVRLGKYELENDEFMRFVYGLPKINSSEWAFIEHGIAALKESGKLISVVGNGPLFRTNNDEIIRRNLLKEDLVEAVIQLRSGALSNTQIAVSILIINREKPNELKNSVFMIDASNNDESGQEKDFGVQKIIRAYKNLEEKEGFSKIVPFNKLEEHSFSLVPSNYVLKLPDDPETREIFKAVSKTPKIQLKEISEIFSGTDKKRLNTVDEKSGLQVSVLKVSSINEKGGIDLENADMVYMDKEELEKVKLLENDILISSRGTIDKVGIVRGCKNCNLVAGANLIVIRVNSNKHSPDFLFELLHGKYGKYVLSQIASGGVIRGLSVRNLENLRVPVIDSEKYEKCQKEIEQINRKIEELNEERIKLEQKKEKVFTKAMLKDTPDE